MIGRDCGGWSAQPEIDPENPTDKAADARIATILRVHMISPCVEDH
jgi:hypothetical protein